jgi:membrane-associated phospholipid phosphatase
MQKALERALSPRKPAFGRGLSGTAGELSKGRLRANTLWIALSIFLLCLAFLIDGPVTRLFTLQSSTFWEHLAVYSSKAGEGWVVAVAGIMGTLTLFVLRRFNASRLVFLVASTGLLTGAAATIIRSLLGRTRPSSHELQGFYGVWHDAHWIIGKYEFGAFPSGHAATVIGLAAAAWLIDRRFGMLAAFYAILVSWSRIALGCHHFSDEVAAGILGVYGAHIVLARLGPSVHYLGQRLQDTWQARARSLNSVGGDQD